MSNHITIFDTTLRDGAQGSGVNFSLTDKHVIALALDAFGIDFIEGGWPGANPADSEFFENPPQFKNAKLVAFGMTCRANKSAANDPSLAQVINGKNDSVCLVGKSSKFQVDEILKIPHQENLRIIQQSCQEVVKRKGKNKAFFDAEHFFDGYKLDKKYTLECLQAAHSGGATWLVMCDTNGGTMPDEVEKITREVIAKMPDAKFAIHAHNDTENAVANSMAAVRAGVRQVQGTINGIGERCGNANLITIIPNLMLKMNMKTSIDIKNLERLLELSRLVDSRLNQIPRANAPYVGKAAFAHKGGLHGAATAKNTSAYEHITPEIVGNRRKIVVSDQAGKANLNAQLNELNLHSGNYSDETLDKILAQVKKHEAQGYSYEDAAASLALLVLKETENNPQFYKIKRFRVLDEKRWNAIGNEVIESEAIVALVDKNENSSEKLTVATSSQGPVNALDQALRKGLIEIYPSLKSLRLVDYKVRIIPPDKKSSGTEATTRVAIDFMDKDGVSWTTVGVSANIIVASLQALDDAYRYMLFREKQKNESATKAL